LEGNVLLNDSSKKDRDILKSKVSRSIQLVFQESLCLMQMLMPPNEYKLARSKILGVGNDQIRYVEDELENYLIKYSPYKKQIIQIER
jgi:hypothetical protein